MNGKDHYNTGIRCLNQVSELVEKAGETGHITEADKGTLDVLATLGNMHFAAATAYALNFDRIPVRSVTG